MLFLAHTHQVELVNNESWWSQNSGSIFLAVAAILAAGLAAYVATRNHRQELQHDRKMRNREATREVIDDSLERIGEALMLTATLGSEVWALEQERRPLTEPGLEDEQQRAAATASVEEAAKLVMGVIEPAFDAANMMDTDRMRLAIRLGDGHPVVAHHRKTREALNQWHDAIVVGTKRNRSDDEAMDAQARLEEFGQAKSQLDAACRDWFNE
jgi:hypothetical protein